METKNATKIKVSMKKKKKKKKANNLKMIDDDDDDDDDGNDGEVGEVKLRVNHSIENLEKKAKSKNNLNELISEKLND
jgi:hypothetical protein